MNRKAILKANVVYLILAIAFLVLLSAFIWDQSFGSALWSDYYAKEITRVINTASPGQEVTIDVHQATTIAYRKGVTNFETLFEFHNDKNEVCVKLSPLRKTCYSYFSQLDVTEYKIIPGRPVKLLYFKLKDKPQNE